MPWRSLSRAGWRLPELSFAEVRERLKVPAQFPADVLAAAESAARSVRLPAEDRRELALVTIDPAGSTDLDQAQLIERRADGFRVWYAIADVPAFVPAGGPVDAEARRRGETLYSPDLRTPLHPAVLSEGAASLLPGQDRPAALWRIDVDGTGIGRDVEVRRSTVRSVAQLDYAGVQASIEAGTPHPSIAALPELGTLLEERSRARHAIELDVAEQEVEQTPEGRWALRFRHTLPIERANAEISLLTGMCAAALMAQAGLGILRTVPAPGERQVSALRRIAPALDVHWPAGAAPGDVISRVDGDSGKHAAFLAHAMHLMRGAGYRPFEGPLPADATHAGVGAAYAHVTAPLRRLVDRFGTEICLATVAGAAVPDWVRAALPTLPELMTASGRRAGDLERSVVDLAEAWLLQDRVGETFAAVVLEAEDGRASVALEDPAVRTRCRGSGMEPGQRIEARLDAVDVSQAAVTFSRV
jgi:exoribonuclease R